MSWSGIRSSTIEKHLEGEIYETVVKKKAFLGLLESNGRISYDGSGRSVTKRIRYRRTPMATNSELMGLSFPQYDKRVVAEFDMRGHVATQGLSEWNSTQNQGKEAIIKLWADMVTELVEDIRFYFNRALLLTDGYAPGNETAVCGLDSMFGHDGTLIGNKVLRPNDNYGTIDTALGSMGGEFTGTWPVGFGDPEFDFWSPLIVKASGSGWGAGGWQEQCVKIVRFVKLHAIRNDERMNVMLVNQQYMEHLMNKHDTKEQVIVQRGSTKPGDVGFGFETIWQDGLPIIMETDLPNDTAFGISFDSLRLVCWPLRGKKKLFHYQERQNMQQQADEAAVKFYGNLMCFNVRANAKVIE